MPKHEPEVIAAVRHRKPLNDRVVLDVNFPRASRNEQVLCCPRCGYQYMHRGLHHETSCGKADSLHIRFSCEGCGDAAAFELVITDYKGNVFVEWREPPWAMS
jgi:hypothetical protein